MSQRAVIAMSDAEIDAFLAEPHKLQLATINADGTPHLVTMYYAVFHGRIGFWTYRKSQKAVNIRRDPRVTCLVETGDGYEQLRGVQIQGRVETVSDFDQILEIGTAVYGRYQPDLIEVLGDFLQQQARKRDAYLVDPDQVASWDHRKLITASAAS